MRSTAAFGRLEQFHLEPELDVGRAVQRPDAARPLIEKRTEPAGATPTEVSFGPLRLLRTQFLFAGRRQARESRNSRSGNPDCFAWLRSFTRRKDGVQLDLAHVPVSEDARTSGPSEISFLAAPTVIETSPSPATAAANPTSLKVTTRRPLTVTEVTFPLLVNDHERPSPDGATQGSSV